MFLNWSAFLLEEICRKCRQPVMSSLSCKSNLLLTLCSQCRQFIELNNNAVSFLDLELESKIMPVICATSYKGLAQRVIRRLKYDDDRIVARDLGQLMFESFDSIVNKQRLVACLDTIVVTPVPLHKSKARQRGYNQAALLALNFLKSARLKKRARYEELLERTKVTNPMFGLNRKERFENVNMAFACRRFSKHYLTNKTIILVDDVFTSGATLKECARTLVASGAESIIAMTAARSI